MAEVTLNNAVAMTFENTRSNNGGKRVNGSNKPKVSAEQRRENNIDLLKRTIQKDGGRYVTFGGSDYGLLAAAVENDNKFYFIWIDKDRHMQVTSTKESYKLLREIPGNLSVLEYLYQNQRNSVRGIVDNWIENNEEYKVITDIGVRGVRPQTGGKKNNKGKNKKSGGKNTAQTK